MLWFHNLCNIKIIKPNQIKVLCSNVIKSDEQFEGTLVGKTYPMCLVSVASETWPTRHRSRWTSSTLAAARGSSEMLFRLEGLGSLSFLSRIQHVTMFSRTCWILLSSGCQSCCEAPTASSRERRLWSSLSSTSVLWIQVQCQRGRVVETKLNRTDCRFSPFASQEVISS